MFDRITNLPSVRVHVEQQPNDAADAARLYGECVKRAEAQVANATIVKFGALNELTGVVVESGFTYEDNKLLVRLLFAINGENFDLRVENNREAMTRAAYQEIAIKILDKTVAKMLSRTR